MSRIIDKYNEHRKNSKCDEFQSIWRAWDLGTNFVRKKYEWKNIGNVNFKIVAAYRNVPSYWISVNLEKVGFWDPPKKTEWIKKLKIKTPTNFGQLKYNAVNIVYINSDAMIIKKIHALNACTNACHWPHKSVQKNCDHQNLSLQQFIEFPHTKL